MTLVGEPAGDRQAHGPPDAGRHRQADGQADPDRQADHPADARPPRPPSPPPGRRPSPRPASPVPRRPPRTRASRPRRASPPAPASRESRRQPLDLSPPPEPRRSPLPPRGGRLVLSGPDSAHGRRHGGLRRPSAGGLPARVRKAAGVLRRPAADRRRSDQLPAPHGRRDAAAARGPSPASGCSTSGAGSGWTTALLAHLVGPTGEVRRGRARARAGRLRRRQPRRPPTSRGRGSGRPRPGCSATRTTRRTTGSWSRPSPTRCPQELVDQLGPAGRMVIPVAGWMTLVVMPGPVITEHGPYRFVPLR